MADWATVFVYFGLLLLIVCGAAAASDRWLLRDDETGESRADRLSWDDGEDEWRRRRDEDGPTDDEIYNRPGVEGGIGYDIGGDEPGSLGEHDWRL